MPSRFYSFFRHRLAIPWCALALTTATAQDENPELMQAQAQYRKDVEFATKPIRDRYLSRLDALKRQLGARGDARAALAIQEEVDRVVELIPDETVAAAATKLAGTWKISYTTGESRTYAISADGTATFLTFDASGKAAGSIRRKLSLRGGDVLVIFQEGAIERLKLSGGKLQVEHFNPKTTFPKGPPSAKGVGTQVVLPKE